MFKCTWSYLKLLAKSQKRVFQNLSVSSSALSSICRRESEAFRSASHLYVQCLRKNSKTYISTASAYAKTKYSLQNTYDRLVHGKREKSAAQVAFMITKDMKQSLADLGFNAKLVASLKPAIAQYIINHDISYSKWVADSASIIQACEKEETERRAAAEEEARIAAEEARKELELMKVKEMEEAAEGEQTSEPVGSADSSNSNSPTGGLVLVREEEFNIDELNGSKSAEPTDNSSKPPSLMVVEDEKERKESF